MIRIVPTHDFYVSAKKLRKRYKSFENDYLSLIAQLKENPTLGVEIAPGYRKIRLAITSKGKGKSGGLRVITYLPVLIAKMNDILYLMEIYDKSETENIKITIIKERVKALMDSIQKETNNFG